MNANLPWALDALDPAFVVDCHGNEVLYVHDEPNAELIVEWSRLGMPADIAAKLRDLADRERDETDE